MNGYIKLHRKLIQWEWYHDQNTFKLFIHCLLMANHKSNNWRGLVVESGEFVTSYEKLKVETGLTTRQVRTSLKRLISTQEIEHKTTSQFSVIKVLKYCDYQTSEIENDKQSVSQTTSKRQTNDKQTTTNKNDKNDKNDKNIINGRFTPPTIEEISNYCLERKNTIDPQYFMDYHIARDWMLGKVKMKNWKATIRTWEKRQYSKKEDAVPMWYHDDDEVKTKLTDEERKKIIAKVKGAE